MDTELRPTIPVVERETPASVGRAAGRYWFLVLLLALAGTAAGIAGALQRHPTYTATSTLSVGQASLSTQSLAGYAAAVQNLTSVYSRVVQSDQVLGPVARATHRSVADLRARTSATPVPSSAVLRVQVTSSRSSDAVRLTRLIATSATKFIAVLSNDGHQSAADAFTKYLRASHLTRIRRAQSETLARKHESPARIAKLESNADASNLIAQTYASIYTQNRSPTDQDFKGAEILVQASSASSDRSSWVQRLGLAGFAAGLLVGIALAGALQRRRMRRAWS